MAAAAALSFLVGGGTGKVSNDGWASEPCPLNCSGLTTNLGWGAIWAFFNGGEGLKIMNMIMYVLQTGTVDC